MKSKKLFYFLIILVIAFKINCVVYAVPGRDVCSSINDSDKCNNTKESRLNISCKWFEQENKTPYCGMQCSRVHDSSVCDDYVNCAWIKSGDEDGKCVYNEEAKCSQITDHYSCVDAGCDFETVCSIDCGNLNGDQCQKREKDCTWNTKKIKCEANDSVESDTTPQTKNSKSEETTYENFNNGVTSCGNHLIDNIPKTIIGVVHIVYLTIQIAVPILLVIFGMLDLFKGITAQKEDEIKKGQQIFVKRLINAAIIFFALIIVKLLIGIIADSNSSRIIKCVDCFIDKQCD